MVQVLQNFQFKECLRFSQRRRIVAILINLGSLTSSDERPRVAEINLEDFTRKLFSRDGVQRNDNGTAATETKNAFGD